MTIYFASEVASKSRILAYIDTLPYDTIADSARKLVDAYADMLNSTDSGEGIFYPDETDANRFWTAIYNYEINQRGYLDADDVNYWMYKGYRMDSRQNVQDVANAMYGHIVELPPRDYVPSYCPKDSDTCYYFGIGGPVARYRWRWTASNARRMAAPCSSCPILSPWMAYT